MAKLTLRDLFAIVALALGWAIDRRRQAVAQADLEENVGSLEVTIEAMSLTENLQRTLRTVLAERIALEKRFFHKPP